LYQRFFKIPNMSGPVFATDTKVWLTFDWYSRGEKVNQLNDPFYIQDKFYFIEEETKL